MSSSSDAACTSAGCSACMSLIVYEEGSAPSFLMTRGSVYRSPSTTPEKSSSAAEAESTTWLG